MIYLYQIFLLDMRSRECNRKMKSWLEIQFNGKGGHQRYFVWDEYLDMILGFLIEYNSYCDYEDLIFIQI